MNNTKIKVMLIVLSLMVGIFCSFSLCSIINLKSVQDKNTDFINSLDKTCVAWLSDETNEEVSIEELYSLQAVADLGLLDDSDENGNLTITGFFSPDYVDDGWDIYYTVENSSGLFYESIHLSKCVKYAFVLVDY